MTRPESRSAYSNPILNQNQNQNQNHTLIKIESGNTLFIHLSMTYGTMIGLAMRILLMIMIRIA